MYLGVDIGGTKCALVLGNANGEILKKVKFATTNKDETVERICKEAKLLTAEADKLSEDDCKIEAIGISCGGPLDSSKGIILSPPNLPGWDEVPITKLLEEATGIKAYLCNDANACALAEYRFGAGRGTKDMIFLTFGTGMGAGIMAGGRLIDGANGLAGEVGHIRVAAEGPLGYGKHGSFEGFCSGGGIPKLASYILERSEGKKIPDWVNGEIDAALICQKAAEGDAFAKVVIQLSAVKLGQALSLLVDILNPSKIVIGSIYSRREELFKDTVLEIVKSEALEAATKNLEIVPAKLGESIGDMAAIAVAMGGYND